MNNADFRDLILNAIKDFEMNLVGLINTSGRVLSSPTESSFIAKLVETAILQHLTDKLSENPDLFLGYGGERTYPDFEVLDNTDNTYFAVDIKCASVDDGSDTFNSRPTLYTFGTYLKYRDETVSGILRPYNTYNLHLGVVAIYSVNYDIPAVLAESLFDQESIDNALSNGSENQTHQYLMELIRKKLASIVRENPIFNSFELCVVETWKVASHLMSSGTRDYVGSVRSVSQFKREQGVFDHKEAFLSFWEQVPSKNGEVLSRIWGRKGKRQSSHCTLEEFAAITGRDVQSLLELVRKDNGFPVFRPESSEYYLESKLLPGKLLYPYIAGKYLGMTDGELAGIEDKLFKYRGNQLF